MIINDSYWLIWNNIIYSIYSMQCACFTMIAIKIQLQLPNWTASFLNKVPFPLKFRPVLDPFFLTLFCLVKPFIYHLSIIYYNTIMASNYLLFFFQKYDYIFSIFLYNVTQKNGKLYIKHNRVVRPCCIFLLAPNWKTLANHWPSFSSSLYKILIFQGLYYV